MEAIGTWLSQNAIALLALFLTPFLAWIFNRRNQNAAAKKTDAEGADIIVTSSGKLVTSWQDLALDMEKKYSASSEQNEKINKTNATLVVQNSTLIAQNAESKEQNKTLIEQMEDMKKRIVLYTQGMEKIFELMVAEIETSNPDLARKVRDSFSEISKIISQ